MDDSSFGVIYDVIVHPDYQKKGIGTILMNEVFKYIQSNNISTVHLFYVTDNIGVDKFYEKFGFEKISNAMQWKK